MNSTYPRIILFFALALGLVFLAFGAAHSFGFVNFDDPSVIVENRVIEGPGDGHFAAVFSTPRDHAYLPLYYASFWIDHAIGGKNPRVYHVINLILHALNGLLLALLVSRLLGGGRRLMPVAALGVAVFLVHPVTIESVVWASGRKDLVSGFFLLAALLSFRIGSERDAVGLKRVIAALLLLAALFAKASVLPGVFLAYLVGGVAGGKRVLTMRERFVDLAPMIAVTALALTVHLAVARAQGTVFHDEVSLGARAIGMIGALGRYGLNVVLPMRLSLVYDIPFDGSFGILQILGLGMLATGALAVLRYRRGQALWALALLWFLAGLVPFNNIFPRFAGVMADRYLYVPLMGVAILAALLAAKGRPRPLALGLMGLAVIALLLGSRLRTEVWRDSATLWTDARTKAPAAVLPLLQLGHVHEADATKAEPARSLELLDDAARLFEQAFELARDDRQRAQSLLKLASLETRRGRFELALVAFDRLEACLPTDPDARDREELDHARVTRATALAGLGRLEEAKALLVGIDRESSAWREARQNQAAIVLLEADQMLRAAVSDGEHRRGMERYQEGLEIYHDLLALHPDFEQARIDQVNALIGARWIPDYEIEVTKAVNALVRDFPENAQAWYHHARVYGEVDSLQALGDLKISVKLDPFREEPYLYLVQILRGLGNNKDAKLVIDKGLASLPDSTRLKNALTDTYVSFGYHHRNTGNLELALESAARALDILPDSIAAWQLLGEVRQSMAETAREAEEQRDNWSLAEKAYRKLLEFDDHNGVARKGIALFHRVRGYAYLKTPLPTDLAPDLRREQRAEIRRQAMEEFRAAVLIAPGLEELEAVASQLLGYAAEFRDAADEALARGEGPTAFPLATRALHFAPDDPENLALLARTKAALGLYDDAMSYYEQALEVDAKHLRSLFDFGRLCYERKNWEKARELMKRFLAAAPDEHEGVIADLRLTAEQVVRRVDERLAAKEEK